ncbi:hypothetical protein R1C46_26540 [Bacillus tropicus]
MAQCICYIDFECAWCRERREGSKEIEAIEHLLGKLVLEELQLTDRVKTEVAHGSYYGAESSILRLQWISKEKNKLYSRLEAKKKALEN